MAAALQLAAAQALAPPHLTPMASNSHAPATGSTAVRAVPPTITGCGVAAAVSGSTPSAAAGLLVIAVGEAGPRAKRGRFDTWRRFAPRSSTRSIGVRPMHGRAVAHGDVASAVPALAVICGFNGPTPALRRHHTQSQRRIHNLHLAVDKVTWQRSRHGTGRRRYTSYSPTQCTPRIRHCVLTLLSA